MKTIEEKAKAYDEIIERAKTMLAAGEVMYGKENNASQLITDLIPELCESEDERMRKLIIDRVRSAEEMTDGLRELLLTYLEKHKEQKPCEDNGTDGDIMQYIEEGEKRGIKEVISFPEKYGLQKKQKPDVHQINMTIHPGPNIPSCPDPVIAKVKELKSKESEDERIRKEIIDYFESRLSTAEDAEILYFHCWIAYLEKQKKQKPSEKQDYSGLTDFERAIHRGFLCAGVDNVPVTIIKETAQDCLAHLPAEWSEEDKLTVDSAIFWLKKMLLYENAKDISTPSCPLSIRKTVDRLKSIRPSWKPSEEQMKRLADAVESWRGGIGYNELKSLYNDLLKLKSL